MLMMAPHWVQCLFNFNIFELKSLRRNKKIPGVYYSYDSTNILFQIDESEIHNAIQSGANIFSVNVGGNDQNVIFKSVQYHPVTDKIIHIDYPYP